MLAFDRKNNGKRKKYKKTKIFKPTLGSHEGEVSCGFAQMPRTEHGAGRVAARTAQHETTTGRSQCAEWGCRPQYAHLLQRDSGKSPVLTFKEIFFLNRYNIILLKEMLFEWTNLREHA